MVEKQQVGAVRNEAPTLTINASSRPYELTLDKFLSHAAKWHSNAQIVTGGGTGAPSQRIDYAALYNASHQLSGALVALGIRRGQRIATLAWNSQGHMKCWYAAFGIGVSCHALNPRLSPPQIADRVSQADDRLSVISLDLAVVAEQILPLCPGITAIVVLDEPGASNHPLPASGGVAVWTMASLLAEQGAFAEWGGVTEEDEAALCFTSGTTGAPKGVSYSHRCNYLVTLALLQRDVLGIGADDTILAAVPMFQANGWGLPLAAPATGAKLVFPCRHNDGASLTELIRSEGVTLAVGVPTVWLGLIEHLEATDIALPTLRRVILGGSGVPQALINRIEARLGVNVQTSWGMTELSPLGTVTAPGSPGRATISGRPPVTVDLRLVDEAGAPLEDQRSAEGLLQVKGASAIHKYFGRQDAVAADGWFDTGDLATIDTDGNLSITGRAKDLIKSGGEWINPGEIEALVGDLPGVSLVAVIGRSHSRWSERPVVVLEASEDMLSDAEVHAALDGRIPRWWMPDAIFRIDRMPIAMTGKIDKQRLWQLYGTTPDPDELS